MRTIAILAVLLVSVAGPATACGFSEAPGDCGQTPEMDARDMLKRVVAAVKADEPAALLKFSRGENGFRTSDTYVFCVGPDGIMSAHPNKQLQGTDVRDLHDSTGNRFIATMLATAKPGQVSSIRYLFPRPGGTREFPKVTFYTLAGDQVCGVGAYDDIAAEPALPASPQARVAMLRQRLTAEMPAGIVADWLAFQAALDDDGAAKAAAFARVRDQVVAAEPTLAAPR